MDRIPQLSLEKEKVSFSDGVLRDLTVYRKVLGRLDQELRPSMDHAYLLAPKNYCVYGFSDGKPSFDKLKGKGVSFKGNSCVYEDGVPLSEDPLRFFKDYVEKGEVIVNCMQFSINKLQFDYSGVSLKKNGELDLEKTRVDFGVRKLTTKKVIKKAE